MELIELPFIKLSASAVTPTRATKGSVGLDFYSPAHYIIPPHSHLLIPTQIKLQIPLGHYGRLASKSGIGHITSITCRSRSYRSRLYGRNNGLVDQYCFTCSYHQ